MENNKNRGGRGVKAPYRPKEGPICTMCAVEGIQAPATYIHPKKPNATAYCRAHYTEAVVWLQAYKRIKGR